jgi:hypothetical protein
MTESEKSIYLSLGRHDERGIPDIEQLSEEIDNRLKNTQARLLYMMEDVSISREMASNLIALQEEGGFSPLQATQIIDFFFQNGRLPTSGEFQAVFQSEEFDSFNQQQLNMVQELRRKYPDRVTLASEGNPAQEILMHVNRKTFNYFSHEDLDEFWALFEKGRLNPALKAFQRSVKRFAQRSVQREALIASDLSDFAASGKYDLIVARMGTLHSGIRKLLTGTKENGFTVETHFSESHKGKIYFSPYALMVRREMRKESVKDPLTWYQAMIGTVYESLIEQYATETEFREKTGHHSLAFFMQRSMPETIPDMETVKKLQKLIRQIGYLDALESVNDEPGESEDE